MRFTQLLEAKLACCLHMNDIRHEYRMKSLDALCSFINLFGMLFSTKGLHVIIQEIVKATVCMGKYNLSLQLVKMVVW